MLNVIRLYLSNSLSFPLNKKHIKNTTAYKVVEIPAGQDPNPFMELRFGHIINGPTQQIVTTSTLSTANMDFMTPPIFDGSLRSDQVTWIFKFELYAQPNGLSEEGRRACFILCMNDVAAVWIKSLKDAATKSWDEFHARFGKTAADNSDRMLAVWTAKQSKSEPVCNYYDRIISMAADLDMSEQLLTSAIQACLNPAIKQFFVRNQPKSLKELLDSATLAESTDYNTFDTALPDSIATTLRLEKKLDDTHLASITNDQKNYSMLEYQAVAIAGDLGVAKDANQMVLGANRGSHPGNTV